jgi:hypothetical protein
MTEELEAAAAESASQALPAALAREARHGDPAGARCANCGTLLQGPWCHRCGQSEHDYHRSTWHLLVEFVEGVFHVDGRLWRTIPTLLFAPARLTRSYVDGHRASQVPPLRMFLVLLLVLFIAGPAGESQLVQVRSPEELARKLPADQRDELQQAQKDLAEAGKALGGTIALPDLASADRLGGPLQDWLRETVRPAIEHPAEFRMILEQWSERFAFLMLPVAALLLKLLFAARRDLFLFDHLVFSMHSLSFQCLVLSALVLGEHALPEGLAAVVLLAAPVHLFAHLRGFYRIGTFATLWRMLLLGVGSSTAAVLLGTGLIAIGLWKVGAG